jgi:hypothetical protein
LSSAFVAGREELSFFEVCFTAITLLPAHARIALFLPLASGSGLALAFILLFEAQTVQKKA